MKCCQQHGADKNNGKHRGHRSHTWMMLLCCGLPMVLLAVISLLGTGMPGVRSALIGILPFLCPVMMIAMIPMMFRREDRNEQCVRESSLQPNGTGDKPADGDSQRPE